MNRPVVTIVIATFNSEATLQLVFNYLSKQTIPKDQVETLVLDGGSTDSTITIAKKNRALVIPNPRTEPNYAKFLGYLRAKGKYVIFVDSDEGLENRNSLKNRVNVFRKNPRLKILVSAGFKNPSGYSFINQYLSEYGDPFSLFIYHTSKGPDEFIGNMRKKYPVFRETNSYLILDFSSIRDLPLFEATGGCTMIDASYLKRAFPLTRKDPSLLHHAFYLIHSQNPYIGISKNDYMIHYSSSTIKIYLNKISWHIKNNIYHRSTMGSAGFYGREMFMHSRARDLKKYLFIPYALLIVFPLADALKLSVIKKDPRYMIHVPLAFYIAVLIIYHTILKSLGVSPKLRSYGENRLIR